MLSIVISTLCTKTTTTTTTTTTIITVLRTLYMSTCVSRHLQLRTGGFRWCKVLPTRMPLLMAPSAFGLARRRWSCPHTVVSVHFVHVIIDEPCARRSCRRPGRRTDGVQCADASVARGSTATWTSSTNNQSIASATSLYHYLQQPARHYPFRRSRLQTFSENLLLYRLTECFY